MSEFGGTTSNLSNEGLAYIENGQLKPLLAKAYPLAQLVQAQKDFKEKAFFGKLVVTV